MINPGWNALLATGERAVDDQHEEIVRLFDEQLTQLIDAPGLSLTACGELVSRLKDLQERHFAAEEGLLDRFHVDQRHAGAHRDAHADLRRGLAQLESRLGDDADAANLALAEFILHWLDSDLLTQDFAMARQIEAINESLSAEDAYAETLQSDPGAGVAVSMAHSMLALVGRLAVRNAQLKEKARDALLFKAILENSGSRIEITDANASIMVVNAAFERSTGYTAAELRGRNPRMLASGETPAKTYAELWQRLTAGESWSGELFNKRKDGTRYIEHADIFPVSDAAGKVCYYFALKRDVTEERRQQAEVEQLGGRDPLTGLPSRQQFVERLATLLARTGSTHPPVVAVFNIDDLRGLNEAVGQFLADQLLREIGARLGRTLRDDDIVGRVGGDEFAVVLSEGGVQVEDWARRLQQAICTPLQLGDREVEQSASVGLARFGEHGASADALINHAALAVRGAKAKSRGGLAWFAADQSRRTDTLIEELRGAVDRGELVLHFQPQASLHSGEIVGIEALVRWQHPARGMISPGEFIPLAEESGLIVPMSEWIIEEACRQTSRLHAEGHNAIRVGVNLSARHFRFTNLPDLIAAILHRTGLQAHWLELEITEGAMMHDFGGAIRLIERIKSLGARLSLDDFGTGYSSLAYLSRFPIDTVKIDQSFVRDVTTNPVNASIAAATIAMSHKLGKTVIAEGVETEGQLRYLRRNDCDEMQGYYFARPQPIAELGALLASGRRIVFGDASDEPENTLLLVDDEAHIVNALKRVLRREGYRILTAGGGPEALAVLASEDVQVIVSDQRMPDMTGTEFFSRVRSLYPDTVRIVLSGYSEINAVTEAINRGAIYRYLAKPWDDEQLKQEIREAFRYRRASLHKGTD